MTSLGPGYKALNHALISWLPSSLCACVLDATTGETQGHKGEFFNQVKMTEILLGFFCANLSGQTTRWKPAGISSTTLKHLP